MSACTGAKLDSGDNQGFISGVGSAHLFPLAERVDAPSLSGETLDGDQLDLADLRGDVVVLNVWASWCPPCRAEAAALQQVHHDTRDDGVQFVGINTQDSTASALAFESGFGITYPSWDDQDGLMQLQFHEVAPAIMLPSTIVVDRDGRIAARILGGTDFGQLSEIVDKVSSEKPEK
jgi:thiol-disulfide isomerase/thioredoxin